MAVYPTKSVCFWKGSLLSTFRYAVKTAHFVAENCLSILGSSTYLEGNRHQQMAEDLRAFDWWEGTDEILAFYITTAGIGHIATEMQVYISNPVKIHGSTDDFCLLPFYHYITLLASPLFPVGYGNLSSKRTEISI